VIFTALLSIVAAFVFVVVVFARCSIRDLMKNSFEHKVYLVNGYINADF